MVIFDLETNNILFSLCFLEWNRVIWPATYFHCITMSWVTDNTGCGCKCVGAGVDKGRIKVLYGLWYLWTTVWSCGYFSWSSDTYGHTLLELQICQRVVPLQAGACAVKIRYNTEPIRFSVVLKDYLKFCGKKMALGIIWNHFKFRILSKYWY